MPIVHQHGPCSPLAGNKAPSHEEILAADQRRVESIRRRVYETTARGRGRPSSTVATSDWTSTNLPASSGSALGTGNYVVTIGLGTPSERFTVVFDTGSDTTWVQCQPCVAYCYPQQEPLFDPTRSATYANISCASPYCTDLDVSGCTGGHCIYGVQYGDGSITVGFYAQDTLTLAGDQVAAFRFGCGERNKGLFGRTAGLMGLGRGKSSLTVQAAAKYRGVFAYCLPATSSATTGFLDFGPGAPAANARVTPMLVDDGPTFYYVALTGIKVGGRLLPVPASVFSAAGALVDSGTVITRLPPKAYEPLRAAFAAGMEKLGYKKAPAFSILDTCYDLSSAAQGGSVALPAVALVFRGGACLDVDASGILYVADLSQACLAFAANQEDTDVAIIGNTQQKTYGVVYDIGRRVVGFAPGAC
ncbi:hypothetical protein PR202_gb27885 [Eleusine coracana subsp. coracana]|uniref:Peptidase A1 domain-containing protein n=1 Tax=Eleusine coracana subsp. coracana TaxID=191504 RepID=A0AAV5FVT5_ELECO|nr:hypothetical protein PR202_gb27885 [Eleusine coracana subsp. coracana]